MAGLLSSLLLRVYRLGAESLWYDETVSAFLARQPASEIIRHTAGDIHPPGYYLMLHGWQQFTEPTLVYGLEYLLGWSSVIWGVLTVALLYPLGRRLLNRRAALLAVWLAAINPFHLWYSQEVRMYTMGSALGLLCLWAALRWLDTNGSRSWGSLTAYAVAAAIGLYTLYYFSLLLIAVNVIILWLIWQEWHPTGNGSRARLAAWLAAQAGVLLLFAPWLPTFWRQAIEPPVPPWRVPWQSAGDFVGTLNESLAALLVGQTPPVSVLWPWTLTALAAVIVFVWVPDSRKSASGDERENVPVPQQATSLAARLALLTYTFLPIALLYLLTATVTPLYHIRYLFLYAPPFMLILAAAVMNLVVYQRRIGLVAGALLFLISFAGLQQFWFSPSYRADDHRRAVAELADNWRPGDLILVNAGWAYTALDTYWPRQPDGPSASIAPPISAIKRFSDLPEPALSAYDPIVAVTGSVDGSESLGWGDAASDFFAISKGDTTTTLEALAQAYSRIWHYRIYDTVSDPDAVVRVQLAADGQLRSETTYPGRDYLLVQLYETNADRPRRLDDMVSATEPVDYGDVLRLEAAMAPTTANAGEHLYVDLFWTPLSGLKFLETDLSMSLRLYDSGGALIAQQDAPPVNPTSAWPSEQFVRQPLALPVPAYTRPGEYGLELVVYQQDDGVPLTLSEDPRSIHGQRRQIESVEILPPTTAPALPSPLARFDYIDLVDAVLPYKMVKAGEQVSLDLIWRPQSNAYRDNYAATIALKNEDGDIVQSWAEPLGGPDYLSGSWPAELALRDPRHLPLAPDLPSGIYRVTVAVHRSADGLSVPAQAGWLQQQSDEAQIGRLSIN